VSTRALALHLAACAALAAVIRWLAFAPGPVARADADVLRLGPLEWGTPLYRLAQAINALFDPAPYVLLVLAVVAVAVLTGRAATGAVAATVMIGSAVTTQSLKHVLAEWRPSAPYLGPDAWPSGHTTAAAAFAIAVVLVTPPRYRHRVLFQALAGVVVAVAAALVALGSHYPSDVLGGLCVAAAWGAIGLALAREVSPPGRSPRDEGGRRVPS
jgi:membrane-associated phospholipid phosphatase